ncbi:MAG: AraC family transcriptional regulator ligand-binding domain-containing protein [Geminicoccaceae bacterium]
MVELAVRPPASNPAATSLETVARLAAARLESLGIKWRPMAARHGLTLADEPVDGQRISTCQENAFLEEAAQASRDGLFAWRLGDMRLRDFGLIGYAVLNAPTVADALSTLALLVPSACEAVSYVTVTDDGVATFVRTCSDMFPNSVFGLRRMFNILEELVGPEFTPLRAGLACPDGGHCERLAAQIAAPLSADLSFAFVSFPARYLRARIAGADIRLAETLRPYWERQAAGFDSMHTVQHSRLAGALMQTLHHGVPTVGELADNLHVGRAKLEAQLSPLGGYRLFVDDVRRRLAKEMIRRTSLPLSFIAERLGYSEPAAFSHAYRRWTGEAPGADRSLQMSPVDDRTPTAAGPKT